jgi:hypothetical protein
MKFPNRYCIFYVIIVKIFKFITVAPDKMPLYRDMRHKQGFATDVTMPQFLYHWLHEINCALPAIYGVFTEFPRYPTSIPKLWKADP